MSAMVIEFDKIITIKYCLKYGKKYHWYWL